MTMSAHTLNRCLLFIVPHLGLYFLLKWLRQLRDEEQAIHMPSWLYANRKSALYFHPARV